MSTANVKPGSRWRCTKATGLTRTGDAVTIVAVLPSAVVVRLPSGVDGTLVPACFDGQHHEYYGRFVPADPAPEASAAWVPKVGDRVVAHGVVERIDGNDSHRWFRSDSGLGGWVKVEHLRPEAAPAAPVLSAVTAWMCTRHGSVGDRGAVCAQCQPNQSTDDRNLRMQLGDLRAALAKSEERASRAAFLERDNARLRQELAEAKNMRRWREGF